MRIFVNCFIIVSLLLVCSTASGQDSDPDQQKVYPNTNRKDYSFDAPWRVKSLNESIPIIMEIKDADANDLQHLKRMDIFIEGSSNAFYSHDFGGITINSNYYSHLVEFSANEIAGLAGTSFQVGDTVKLKCVMTYRDDFVFVDHTFTKFLHIVISNPFPNINGKWYYGDTHFHTSFTDDLYEYGGTFLMTRKSAIAMGLDWTTTNDHASNNSVWVGPATFHVNDLEEHEWNQLLDSVQVHSSAEFKFIQGEEVTCDDDMNPYDQRSIHLLVYGNSSYIAGPIGWTGDQDNHVRPLSDVLADVNVSGGFAFASHPLDDLDMYVFYAALRKWDHNNFNNAFMQSQSVFAGAEYWNTRKYHERTGTYDYQDPFSWSRISDVDNEWLGQLRDGILQWDSLNIGFLNGGTPRKMIISGGSDAHGSYNYSVGGVPGQTELLASFSDNAFGKVRTVVYSENGMGANGENVIEAMKQGRSVVTDGPLVEFGIDVNQNGQIGVGDFRIGDQGSFNLNDPHNLIVRWESTEDFGTLDSIKIKLGHPLLDGGIQTVVIDHGISVGNYSGLFPVDLGTELQALGITGWCFVRVEGFSGNNEYRCYTNPVWLNVYDGNSTSFFLSAFSGQNGTVDPTGTISVPQSESRCFVANSDQGFEVEYWYLDGNIDQTGGNTYCIQNVQASHSIYVTFKPVAPPSGIQVIAPNGGEDYFLGRRACIVWNTEGDIGTNVRLELLKEGIPILTITPSTYNDGGECWVIPHPPEVTEGCDYQIKVSSIDGINSDISDGYFCIQKPVVIDTVWIYSCADLQKVSSDALNPVDATYLLMNDIDARDCGNFNPIGSGSGFYFRGTFDGQGHTIRRLKIDKPTELNIGLFSILDEGGVIRNLNITEIDGINGGDWTGGLVGDNYGTVINCNIEVLDYIKGKNHVGGIAGENSPPGVIQNCSVNIIDKIGGLNTEPNPDDIGGIAGVNSGRIEWCWTYGDGSIDARSSTYNQEGDNVGGIVGYQVRGHVSECYSTVRWIDAHLRSGGIVGLLSGGEIRNTYYSGSNVNANYRAGGIAGETDGGTIYNCFVTGSINSNDSYEGALVGKHASTVSHSFWCASPNQATGNGGSVINCRNLCDSMTNAAPFLSAGWDFTNIWAINEGVTNPELRGIGTTLPSPTGVVASTDLSDGVHISWNPVTYSLAGSIFGASYKIFRSDLPDISAPMEDISGWQTDSVFIDSAAIPEISYYYWIKAATTANGARDSKLSAYVTGQRMHPPAETPAGVTATDSLPHSVLVEWNGVSNANYFRVYRSNSVGGSKDSLGSWQSGLSFTDIPQYPDTIYYYWVAAAIDSTGDRMSGYGGPDSGYYIQPDESPPTISLSMTPEIPVVTQSVALQVSAGDNELLKRVSLHWSIGSAHDSVSWDSLDVQAFDTSHVIGIFSAGDTIIYWAKAWDAADNSTESDHRTVVVQSEIVTTPSRPEGPVYLRANQPGSYTTGESTTNLSSPVQYRFNWGDSTMSEWGDSIMVNDWASDGIYWIKSQARSSTDTSSISPWSIGRRPTIVDSRPPEVTINTNGGADTTIVDTIISIFGVSVDQEPSSTIDSTYVSTGAPNQGDEENQWSFEILLPQDIDSLIVIVSSVDYSGNKGSDTIIISNLSTNVNDPDQLLLPDEFALDQNYPNPFNPTTVIKFDLPRRSHVSLTIFNLLGKSVRELIDDEYSAGNHQITWDGISSSGQRVSTGIYFYRLVAEDFIDTKKMILLK